MSLRGFLNIYIVFLSNTPVLLEAADNLSFFPLVNFDVEVEFSRFVARS